MFDRFYKTDRSRSMDKTGVGLGLYIVRQIVNLHQGEVIVRSVEGEYCEFSFSVATAPKALTNSPSRSMSVRCSGSAAGSGYKITKQCSRIEVGKV